jgi:hypothetical protein
MMMKCMMCAKETDILTANQVCPECEKRYFGAGTPALEPQPAEPQQKEGPRVWPRTILGMLATILTFLTLGLFAAILLTSKTSLLLVEGVAILTTIPAIVSMLLSLIAFKGMHDRSKVVKMALIVSIVLAVLSIPIAMAVASILPSGSFLPGGFT